MEHLAQSPHILCYGGLKVSASWLDVRQSSVSLQGGPVRSLFWNQARLPGGKNSVGGKGIKLVRHDSNENILVKVEGNERMDIYMELFIWKKRGALLRDADWHRDTGIIGGVDASGADGQGQTKSQTTFRFWPFHGEPVRKGAWFRLGGKRLDLREEGRVTDGKLGSSQLIESPSACLGARAQCLAGSSWVPDAPTGL